MKVKDGVQLAGLKLPMRKVLKKAGIIWMTAEHELVVTSTTDGVHSAGSLHPYGYAVDLRSRYFNDEVNRHVARRLQNALGDKYLVLIEPNHIHVQYQPARNYEFENNL